MRLIPHTLIFSSTLFLLSACGGDSVPSNTAAADTATTNSTTTATTAPATETASFYRGTIDIDTFSAAVYNTAISILDENGKPIDFLDAGDFEIVPSVVTGEDHYDAQKLDYLTHVTGGLVLMLDISDSMAGGRFQELLTAAQKLVTDGVKLGLSVDVYTFSGVGSVAQVPGAPAIDTASAATVNGNIAALIPDPPTTYFFDSIAQIVTANLNNNTVSYNHNPTSTPLVNVELMVIMSDGDETPGTGSSASVVTTAKAEAYSILSIEVGDYLNEANLKAISEFLVPVPSGGTYSDAVADAMTVISNYYNGFYLVDFQPLDRSAAALTYDIKLVGNTSSKFTVKYDGTALIGGALPAVCCRLVAAPTLPVDLTAVSLAAGDSMEFKADQLWTNQLPATNFTWTFATTGGLSITQSADTSTVTVTADANSSGSTATLSVSAGAWSSGTIPISVP